MPHKCKTKSEHEIPGTYTLKASKARRHAGRAKDGSKKPPRKAGAFCVPSPFGKVAREARRMRCCESCVKCHRDGLLHL